VHTNAGRTACTPRRAARRAHQGGPRGVHINAGRTACGPYTGRAGEAFAPPSIHPARGAYANAGQGGGAV